MLTSVLEEIVPLGLGIGSDVLLHLAASKKSLTTLSGLVTQSFASNID